MGNLRVPLFSMRSLYNTPLKVLYKLLDRFGHYDGAISSILMRPGDAVYRMSPEDREALKNLKSEDVAKLRPPPYHHSLRTKDIGAMPTLVVNQKSQSDVYIGRPSIWGNPFIIGDHGTRAEVIEKYRQHILNSPELLKLIPTLKDKVLGCWCKPDACHGDVLAELADRSSLLDF